MKILLSNKFHYHRGGDCIYTLNLEHLLKIHFQDTAVFAMQHPENYPTIWNYYYPSEVRFKFGKGLFEALMRPFGTKEVKSKFELFLNDFKPDVLHLNNIHSQLSPVIAEIAHNQGIRVVWTLHDYKLLCPRYDCLRKGETVCEKCFTDKHKVIDEQCMKNSRIASYLGYKEAVCWNRERLEACTDIFVCPSRFMEEKMIQGGFSPAKIKNLCNSIDVKSCEKETYDRDSYYCYIGRLSHEKGVGTLIKAASHLPYKLVVIGDGPLRNELKNSAASNVEFVGFKQWPEVKEIVGHARFSVIPSEWYENNPLSLMEAQCLGTPVLGADIGGIPELIEDGVTGMKFESRNVEDLKRKITAMWQTSFNHVSIARQSQKRYDSENYYNEIMKIYKGYE